MSLEETLRRLFVETHAYDDMNDREKRWLDLLMTKVIISPEVKTQSDFFSLQASDPKPIHCFGIFAVHLSTFVAGLGICLTYVIVLLQFRIAEV